MSPVRSALRRRAGHVKRRATPLATKINPKRHVGFGAHVGCGRGGGGVFIVGLGAPGIAQGRYPSSLVPPTGPVRAAARGGMVLGRFLAWRGRSLYRCRVRCRPYARASANSRTYRPTSRIRASPRAAASAALWASVPNNPTSARTSANTVQVARMARRWCRFTPPPLRASVPPRVSDRHASAAPCRHSR